MNTPPNTPHSSTFPHQDNASFNHTLIITHLTDAIIIRSWAHDDDLAHALEAILRAVVGDAQITQERFDTAALEIKDTEEYDYRWISLMKVGEALGLVPFVPEFAVHQAALRKIWRQMYGRDLELALRMGVVDIARMALGELFEGL